MVEKDQSYVPSRLKKVPNHGSRRPSQQKSITVFKMLPIALLSMVA